MRNIEYYVGIGVLSLGLAAGCGRSTEPPAGYDPDRLISTVEINGRYVSYTKKHISDNFTRCDLMFSRTLEQPEVTLMDGHCDGNYDHMQFGNDENHMYFARGEFNPDLLAKLDRMMMAAKQGQIPEYTKVPLGEKEVNSKRIAQALGMSLQPVSSETTTLENPLKQSEEK